MKNGEFNKVFTEINDKYINEAENYRVKKNHSSLIALVAACVLICLIAIPIASFIASLSNQNESQAPEESGITVLYNNAGYVILYNEQYCYQNEIALDNIGDAKIVDSSYADQDGNVISKSMVSPSRQQKYESQAKYNVNALFNLANGAIFEGEILSLAEKEIDFNGILSTCTIAKVRVMECFERYRTNHFTKDEEISLLVPGCRTDGGVAGSMKVGRVGIFFAKEYMDDDYWVQNDEKIQLSTLALCGLYDRNDYLILDTGEGLVFSTAVFDEFGYSTTMEDAVSFVKNKIKNLTK